MVTLAQAAANARNAQKSTGPRTPPGKAKSSRNSYKHGMTAEALVGEGGAERFRERRDAWGREIAPEGDLAHFALDRAVVASIRLERCEAAVDEVAVETAARAREVWELDRRVEAAALAEALPRRPRHVARKLETSLHGAEILLEGWSSLGQAAEDRGDWTEAERQSALDHLGVPTDRRGGRTPLDAPEGMAVADHLVGLARSECERLRRLKDGPLSRLEELCRVQAEAGFSVAPGGKAALAVRYEREAQRWFEKMLKLARQASSAAEPEAAAEFAREVEIRVEPTPSRPEPRPELPTGTRPSEPEPEDGDEWRSPDVSSFLKVLRAEARLEPEPEAAPECPAEASAWSSRRDVPTESADGRKLNRQQRRALLAESRRDA